MKKTILLFFALCSITTASANQLIELASSARIFSHTDRYDNWGTELVTYLRGTRLVVASNFNNAKNGYRVIEVQADSINPRDRGYDYRYNTAWNINRPRRNEMFFISFEAVQDAYLIRNIRNNNPRRRIDPVRPNRREPIRDRRNGNGQVINRDRTVTTTPRRTTVTTTTTFEYERCFEGPRRKYTEVVNQGRHNDGRDMAIIGGLAAILGTQIDGDAGAVFTGLGAALGVAGLIKMDQSTSTRYSEPTIECRKQYRTETRTKTINRRRCSTTRYYQSHRGNTVEYFETTCGRDRFVSYQRNSQIW